MVTLKDYLMGRDRSYPLSDQNRWNAETLLGKVNEIELESGIELECTSGWRPGEVNQVTPGAARGSSHVTCEGIDLRDTDKKLSSWLVSHPETLIRLGLYMESPIDARDHVHLQTRRPKSGNRIFKA